MLPIISGVKMKIPFNIPLITGKETNYLQDVLCRQHFSADGYYCDLCSKELQKCFAGCEKVYLTSSCTAALEVSALLLDLHPGDEVILPSYTHVGTANPFLRAGAKLIWCDIEADTMNIDPDKLAELITTKTRLVVAVHYAGISCRIDEIKELCDKHGIALIEDCAMAIGSKYDDRALGTFGSLSVVSFHETKNIHCGEGGALIINDKQLQKKAEILMNCGTDKKLFDTGKTDHYSWLRKSSNFNMSELQAAFLFAQLQNLETINQKRNANWQLYYQLLSNAIDKDNLPSLPKKAKHNGHLFYLHTKSKKERAELINYLHKQGKNRYSQPFLCFLFQQHS